MKLLKALNQQRHSNHFKMRDCLHFLKCVDIDTVLTILKGWNIQIFVFWCWLDWLVRLDIEANWEQTENVLETNFRAQLLLHWFIDKGSLSVPAIGDVFWSYCKRPWTTLIHAVSFFFYDWVLKKSLAHLLQVSRSNSSMPCQFLGLLPRLTSTLSSLLGSLNFFSF